MSLINCQSFDPLSGNKEKAKLALSQTMCTTLIPTLSRKIEQVCGILLISQKTTGWSDLKVVIVELSVGCSV